MTEAEFADGREPIRKIDCDDGLVVNVYLDHNGHFEAYVDGEECRAVSYQEVTRLVKVIVSRMKRVDGRGVPVTLIGQEHHDYKLTETASGDDEQHELFDCYYRGEHATAYMTSLFAREDGSRFNLKSGYTMARRLSVEEKERFLDLVVGKRAAEGRVEKFLETFEGDREEICRQLSQMRASNRKAAKS